MIQNTLNRRSNPNLRLESASPNTQSVAFETSPFKSQASPNRNIQHNSHSITPVRQQRRLQSSQANSKAAAEAMRALQEKCAQQESTISKLKQQAYEAKIVQEQEIEELRQKFMYQIQEEQQHQEELKSKSDKLQKELQLQEEQIETIQRQKQELEIRCKQMQQELFQQHNIQTQQKQEWLKQYENAMKLLESEKMQRSSLQKSLESNELEKQNLKIEIENQNKRMQEMQYEISEKDKKQIEFSSQEKAKKYQHDQKLIKLEAKQQDQVKINNELQEELQRIRNLNQEYSFTIDQLKNQIQDLNNQLYHVDQSRAILAQQNERAQNLMKDVVQVNEKLVSTLKKSPNHSMMISNNYSGSLQSSVNQNKELKKSKKTDNQETALSITSLSAQQSKTDYMQKDIDQLTSDLSNKNAQYKQLLSRAHQTNTASEMQQLRNDLSRSSQEIESISEQLFQLKKKQQALMRERLAT